MRRREANRDHLFSFRLDLDVDGTTNSMQIDRLQQERLPDGHSRRSLWVVNSEVTQTESDAMLRLSFERPKLWRVMNPAAHTLELRPFDFFDRNPALDLPKQP